ncbi:MAG TPA: sigma-70 family RNA polymerase sigma factor [Lacunisphaera sp.]|nr:sigma-70 family RNA polymerase sigma factor [Lacunisphaera sp.]
MNFPATAAGLALRLIPADHPDTARVPNLAQLTMAMARGEDAAWSEFNRAYGPAVFRQLLALTRGDHALAQDALQQTYLRVAKHVRPCESEAMFKGWLRTVARSALLDCWRRRRSFTALLFRKQQEPPELANPADDDRLVAQLDGALSRLDAADRSLLEAKYFSGREVRSLAEQLGLTPKAVESRLTRAREALRRELLAALQNHE